ncbi:aminomethyl-transferring glycine dehydrogenase subunit GcvPA [Caproiciproducens sp. NJN-50]|uniref:aminomethyl-transferring glycine dehydrogenase subunit GcvPA n=1 Tax=Acutalibacteraceae TaxID=3082771 RepID=UPI000FFE01EE|nr:MULTISPECIES: aminomethyl-transferring glycine dehydrogenase subunit GcvPA [Acutalibacteraceae]QAT49164.1 aminomethyl-transferring glycine dehydrogenase subunit GcvPA [Caproiciproducens sp. NJN-50]
MGSYIPSTEEEQNQMLSSAGFDSFDGLFSQIPESVRLNRLLDLPQGLSELEVRRKMGGIAAENKVFPTVFRGAGAYRHYIPAAVTRITAKENFLTAYTPYQAEISQGILQSIFEYQTMICELTGMDVSNASVYDGANAAAEAAAMCRDRGRTTVYLSAATHPDTIRTVRTYAFGANAEVRLVPIKDGATDADALKTLLSEDKTAACFFLQQPNYFGTIEDAQALGEIAHASGAKFVMGCNPVSLAVLKTPAECGADIAVGEGQPLGMPLGFGGPYLGFMACKKAMMRRLPGRIVGQTSDAAGNRAFVLTLQAREQHIRREKALSNICSNEALCALTASVYLSVMGPDGFQSAARQCYSKAHYAAEKISAVKGFELKNKSEFFHEFVTGCPNPEKTLKMLEQQGILGGLPLPDGGLLWCVTELNTKEEIDRLAGLLEEDSNEIDF